MFIFLYTVFRNSSISDEHVFCVALHFTIGQKYISQKVKYFRKQNKMSQEELSEQAGLGLKYINQLENQNVNLTIHSLEKVIVALNLTPEDFFNFNSLEPTTDQTDNLSLKRVNMKLKQVPVDKREKILAIFEDILDNL